MTASANAAPAPAFAPDQHPAGQAVIAPLSPRFRGVQRIAVLRAGGLGDLLFAMPAMQALAAAYPEAEVTLLGTALAERLLQGRPGAPHRIRVLPCVPGVGASAQADADEQAIAAFLADCRADGFDLAVQVHGGGRFSNPFLQALGARHTVGTRTPDAAELERSLEYVYYQHEVLRALEVAGLAGAAPVVLEPTIALTPAESDLAAQYRSGGEPLVVLHPGATDPRRRWPTERFAAVAAALAAQAARVVLVGDGEDVELCARIAAGARGPGSGRIEDLSGQLTLSELTAVLAAADVMLGNDSGPRHLAQAVGTRTVSVYWFGNVVNAGPLGRGRHRVHLSWTTRCPVCDRDSTQVGWTAERCEHDVSFVSDVGFEPVLEDVVRLLANARGSRTD
ncbi:glycosyltransferase family 9 protein [Microbacterium sp. USHLN186]|uniref:glycosyltransferase family 9 protein n=1 Tax=Microbacterium sp. USHLN186 TaxID=3081286 RepID=UPI0030186818